MTDWLSQAAADFTAGLPAQFGRIRWSPERLLTHQRTRLRRLLRDAVDGSSFHRDRLAGLDVDHVDPCDLSHLPVMTKSDVIEHFDDLATDPRVTSEEVEAHIARQRGAPSLMLDEYLTIASGGSSGQRAVFIYHRKVLAEYLSAILRNGLYQLSLAHGWPPIEPIPLTVVAAPSPIHATGAFVHLTRGFARLTLAPATLPLEEIFARTLKSRPMILVGYPSVLARLADEFARSRASLSPKMVITTSERLTHDFSSRIERGLGIRPVNSFGSSEGLSGSTAPGGDQFTFADDLTIIEFVDASERPVAYGETSDHVLVTNLISNNLPLIRYRLDDCMTPLASDPGVGYSRATVEGRADQTMKIGDVLVHSLVLRSVLFRHHGIAEFQIKTAGREVTVDAVAGQTLARAEIEHDLLLALRRAGAAPTSVRLRVVAEIERDSQSGKIRRLRN